MARNTVQDEAVILARREKVASLYLQRATQREISVKLGCGLGTVCRDLKAIQAAWLASAVCNLNERKSEELAKVDHLERTYWSAWRRSCKDAEKRTAKTVGGDSSRTEASKTEEGRDGNPEFLKGVERCIERRCKILGLDAPQKHEHAGPDGQAIPIAMIEVVLPATED